ncbi:MAG: AEC family transporter [Spirochaetes bacterium]|nr:AEC family transporter [Spirochaetota bacterium]MBX3723151.1 AEC family transporter [Turneriella sp.]
MPILALIIVSFLAGILLRRFKKMPENAHVALNSFIIYVSLPALVLKSLRVIPMTSTYFAAALMPWVMFALAVILFLTLERFKVFNRNTTLALILTAGLANTSFVGMPVIEALYGKQYLAVAVILDQLGTFLLLVIVAIPLVDFLRIGEFNMRTAVKDLFLFPPFIALILAFIFQKLRPVEIVYTVIDRFAETLGPLALVSVGLQWQASHLKKFVKELSWGLGFKLLLAPVLIFFIYSAFSYHPDLKKIVVLEAAMGPMITGGIIAMQKNINPPLVAAMLSVGIPLSLLTSLLVRLFFR